MRILKPVGDELIDILEPCGNQRILDVASGTGEHGISIAARVPGGKVMLIDRSAGVLHVAAEHAARNGLNNIETCACDVSALPFADNTFDAISCHFGLMYFSDMLRAAKEMCRVLKPGGKIAVSVWNVPEKNPWVTTILDLIHLNRQFSDRLPAPRDPFRCAEDGYLVNLFIQSSFKNIQIGAVDGRLVLPSAEIYWEMMTEIEPSVIALLEKVDPPRIAKIRYELYELLDQKFRRSSIQLASSALVLFARKNNFAYKND